MQLRAEVFTFFISMTDWVELPHVQGISYTPMETYKMDVSDIIPL